MSNAERNDRGESMLNFCSLNAAILITECFISHHLMLPFWSQKVKKYCLADRSQAYKFNLIFEEGQEYKC